jgi:hypothetical protein
MRSILSRPALMRGTTGMVPGLLNLVSRHERPQQTPPPCVVKLTDGRALLKTIKRGTLPGRYRLVSFNSPDIEDVEVEWAAKIIFIRTS